MSIKKILVMLVCAVGIQAWATTTIDSTNKYAYAANMGWINTQGDVANGTVIGQAFCAGYMYGANVGWIHLGDGSPNDGMAYANNSSTDYGVNHDGLGNLTGYAYAANIGWINFEQTQGQPKVDLLTGVLSGYAWGANVGWIDLSGVETVTIDPGPDTDMDNIPDAWEYGETNSLAVLGSGDADNDGVSDEAEYLADTDPFDVNDFLHITNLQTVGTTNEVSWPVQTTRVYTLEHATSLTTNSSWSASAIPFIPSAGPNATETVPGVTDDRRVYRVKAMPPLAP